VAGDGTASASSAVGRALPYVRLEPRDTDGAG
jgi:hypothetical protein